MAQSLQPKQSKPMETGGLPGTPWLMPLYLSSVTKGKNSKPTANTSSTTLPPFHLNSIAKSSAMIEPFRLELHNGKTLSSQTSPVLTICKFNGSVIQQEAPVKPQSPKIRTKTERAWRDNTVQPVKDGMKTVAPMLLQAATTYMYAQSVLTQTTLPTTVTPQTRSKQWHHGIQWKLQSCFVWEFVWSYFESRSVTTVFVTEKSPPVSKPPWNEFMNKVKLDIIKNYSYLFHIMTPIWINQLHELLSTHPNCSLVNSVCKGLKLGFWPWAITFNANKPLIVNNAHLQKVKDPRHLRFMEEQRDKEVKQSCFSCAFSMLLPGMTSIPLWVVPKPHSDTIQQVTSLPIHSSPQMMLVFTWIHSMSLGKPSQSQEAP